AGLDAVRAGEDEGKREVVDRVGRAVAGEGGDMDDLAGAVDTAFRPGIYVKSAGSGPTLDAAVGQVEAGLGHVEEDHVLIALTRHQHSRHHAAFATGKTRIEAGATLGVR